MEDREDLKLKAELDEIMKSVESIMKRVETVMPGNDEKTQSKTE